MIGIFDSGSGGLSVLRELRKQAPQADVVYFGDLKNAPYGNKSREELGALTVLGIEKLIAEGATEIISACNSVSVSIVLPMFDILDLPRASIVEMVGPTVAALRQDARTVLVVATQATIDSGVYQNAFSMLGAPTTGVAIPDLVGHIESGADEATLLAAIQTALAPLVGTQYSHVVLGCTHYPLVVEQFTCALASLHIEGTIIDPAEAVANAVRDRFSTDGSGTVRLIVSSASPVFEARAAQCLGSTPDIVVLD